jgi:hypothetical protein
VLAQVTLEARAGAQPLGVAVTVNPANAAVVAPPGVRVPPGAVSATFTIKTRPVSRRVQTRITATVGSVSAERVLVIQP